MKASGFVHGKFVLLLYSFCYMGELLTRQSSRVMSIFGAGEPLTRQQCRGMNVLRMDEICSAQQRRVMNVVA